jgi:hypothetical protein
LAKGNVQKPGDQGEVSSPSKLKNQRAKNKQAKNGSGSGKEIVLKGKGEKVLTGQKRKTNMVYQPRVPSAVVEENNPLALAVCPKPSHGLVTVEVGEGSNDSNKKLKCGASNGSADQVGAVDQPHHTQ